MSGSIKALSEKRKLIDDDETNLNQLKLQIEIERNELKVEKKSINDKL